MTQHSNNNAYLPWGEPEASGSNAPLAAFMTVPALLAHIVIMLTVTSALTLLNLLLIPRVWWSFAILAIWFTLVIIHAIGLVSINLLLDEDEERPAAPLRSEPETHGPPVPGWLNLPRRDRRADVTVPSSWELTGTDVQATSWPEQPPAPVEPEPPKPPERLPWRAATDIAWLRRPGRGDATGGDDPNRNGKEAPS